MLKGQSGFIYTPKRSPAWCDRVLFKSALPHNQIVCNSYYAAPDISTSDHKPVAAQLSVPLVTNTVTSGRVTGRVPFKLYVTSVRLQGADSWHWLEELPVGPAAAGQAAGAGNAGSQMSSSTGNKRQQGAVRQRRLKLVLSGACLAGLRQTHVSSELCNCTASSPEGMNHSSNFSTVYDLQGAWAWSTIFSNHTHFQSEPLASSRQCNNLCTGSSQHRSICSPFSLYTPWLQLSDESMRCIVQSMKVDTDALAMAFSDAVATALPNSSIKDPHDSGTQFSLLLREESMALLPGAIQDLQDDW